MINKKIMILTIILVSFLALGAVSASEDVAVDGQLAASDVPQDSIAESTADNVIAEDSGSAGPSADEFNVWIANKTLDIDKDKGEVVINFTSPADAKGDVQVWLNDKYKTEIHIDESTVGKTFNWTLNDLYISQSGVFESSVRYNSDAGGQLEIATGTFTVVKNYSKDDFETYTYDFIGTTGTRIYSLYPVPVYGTLRVYVDGKESYNKYINSKYEYVQLYVGDLNITENGVYNIRSEYVVESSGQVVALDDFNSSVQCMPVTLGITDMDIDVSAGYVASLGYVSDKYGIQGLVTAYIGNNQVFNKEYAVSDDYLNINKYTLPEGFALGNHTVKIVYTKSGKEYTKEGNVSFYADPEVINPGYTMTVGDDKYITVKYYKGTTGTITVYNTEKVSTPPGWKKSTIFMNTADLNGSGIFYVPLNTLDVGYHGLCLNITLGTYSVEKFADFNVIEPVDPRPEVIITVDNPCIVDYGPANITVKTEGALNISAKISGNSLEVIGNTIFINGLDAQTNPYYLVITAVPDEDHKAGSPKAVPLYVNQLDTTVSVPKIFAELGQEVTLVANVKSKMTVDEGNVTFSDDGEETFIGTAFISNGTATLKYTPKTTGTIFIDAIYLGKNFDSNIGTGILEVSKAKTNLTIDPVQTVFIGNASNFTVKVTSNSKKVNEGKVYYYINGADEPIGSSDVIEGVSTYSYTADKIGTYDVKAVFMETGNYSSANASTTFVVQKVVMLTKIDASDVTADYNGGKSLVATLTDVNGNPIANATVSVKIDKVSNLTTDADGKITVSCDGIDPDVYVAEITYKGDDNYFEAKKSVNVTINKVPTKFVVDVAAIEAGQVASINVTLNATASGSVVLKFEKQNYTEEIENGQAIFKISDLSVGNQTFTAVYAGDKYFNNASVTKSIEVKKANITSVDFPTIIAEDGNFTFELPADATGDVVLSINGTDHPAKVVKGKVNIGALNLPKGKYDYNVSYSGDDKYNGFNQSGVLEVNNVATVITFTKVTGECVVEGVLKDAEGNAIAGAELAVSVGNNNLTIITKDDGTFTIQADNNVVVNVTFEGKDIYLPSNAQITLKDIAPVRAATDIIAQDYDTYSIDFKAGERGNYFKVQLVDANGKPLADKPIKIGFNGVVYDRITDSEGRAQLQINLKNAGVYTFAVAYLGDDDYNGSFVVQKITVKEKTTSIAAAAKTFKASAKTKSYTVTLKTIPGSSLDGKTYMEAGKQVKLTINGKTYTANTNSKGQATFKLSITKKGSYSGTVSFAGDKAYKASKATAKIKIN